MTSRPQHKHWHSRGYLPHCDTPGLLQAITFRLADSLPAAALHRLLQEAGNETEKQKKVETLLDAGHGACWLKQPAVADIVEDALLHGDGQRYRLLAWCVMPNHVHVLIETREGWPLSDVLHSWKSFTAKAVNRFLGRGGTVWMRDYFDRYIRDDHHLAAVIAYIHANPVQAGLVRNDWEWPHSSARLGGIRQEPMARSAGMERGHPARKKASGTLAVRPFREHQTKRFELTSWARVSAGRARHPTRSARRGDLGGSLVPPSRRRCPCIRDDRPARVPPDGG